MKRTAVILSIVIVALIALSVTACMTAKKKAEMAQNKPLVETYWVLKSVKGEDIPKNIITPYITFHENGTYTGNLGCNKFFGNYSCGKSRIKMEYGGATKRLCETMKVEKLFMLHLHSDFKQYEVIKDTLILKDKEGEVLRFFAGVRPELVPVDN